MTKRKERKNKFWINKVNESFLLDGAQYDLGAVIGTYNAKLDVFSLGNCFVPRADTVFKDARIETVKGGD